MPYQDNAMRVRREVLIRLAECLLQETPERADRIPLEMRPRRGGPTRCCVHKDRAVIKYRCMAGLGHGVEEETDELVPISEYARRAMHRQRPSDPILTVIDEACSACLKSQHVVTDACRGCMARPCTMNCPKDAIRVEGGRARIDADACVNCGKCVGVCPYHAIVRVPIPCEEACPVGAIAKDETGKETIDYDTCISCGKCMRACPFGAIMEKSQMADVLRELKSDRPTVAMLAPAVVGQFPGTLGQVAEALHQLGFDHVMEVATGADEAAEREAAELVERLGRGDALMTTSCCPAFVQAVKRHLPELAEAVSDTPSPMVLSARWARQALPGATTVFIGPCVAKRVEAIESDEVDYVLTFEELGAVLVAADIDVAECDEAELARPARREGRAFPVSGGVSAGVAALATGADVKPVLVDGLSEKALKLLKVYAAGKCPGNFVEVMACEGGCVAGPACLGDPRRAGRDIEKLTTQTPSLTNREEAG